MATGDNSLYDVFLVHSSEDEKLARDIDNALIESGLEVYAHYRSGDDNDKDKGGFFVGKFVTDNIRYAVKHSRLVLILVTSNAITSGWIALEIIIGLEKSLEGDSMCVRFVFQGMSDEEIKSYKTGDIDYIPHYVLDLNNEAWKTELAEQIKEPNPKLGAVLPMGNVAHGLVFNYFVGFLRNVLPNLKGVIQGTTYHREHKMLQKFVVVIPSSCRVMPLEGKYGDIEIKKMKESLEIKATHGDKFRPYNLSVYSISKGNKSFYFTAECPFIIETMNKITKFAKVTNVGPEFLKLQVERFRKTLLDLVNHRGNLACNNTVCFVDFDDTSSTNEETLGDKLWTAVEIPEEGDGTKTVRKVGKIEAQTDKEYFATITHEENEADKRIVSGICDFLSEKEVKFTNGNGGHMEISILGKAKWNIFVLPKDIHKNHMFLTQLNAAFQESIDNDLIQVIPIVPKDTNISDIPDDFKQMTMLEEKDDQSHFNRMWNIMNAKPMTMMESMPSGPVYQGLAYAYMVNYLAIALDGKTAEGRVFRERFEDAVQKYKVTCPCVPRVFLITPNSCKFPAPGTQFQNEKHIGEVEPVVIGVRKYCLQLYELTMKNGNKICYAREYATPTISLYEMAHTYPFAGMKPDDMKKQAEEFAFLCKKIIKDENFKKHIGDIKDKCVLVYFDDSEKEMPESLEEEIRKIPDTEYIKPPELH